MNNVKAVAYVNGAVFYETPDEIYVVAGVNGSVNVIASWVTFTTYMPVYVTSDVPQDIKGKTDKVIAGYTGYEKDSAAIVKRLVEDPDKRRMYKEMEANMRKDYERTGEPVIA